MGLRLLSIVIHYCSFFYFQRVVVVVAVIVVAKKRKLRKLLKMYGQDSIIEITKTNNIVLFFHSM